MKDSTVFIFILASWVFMMLVGWALGSTQDRKSLESICGNQEVIVVTKEFVNLVFSCKVIHKETK